MAFLHNTITIQEFFSKTLAQEGLNFIYLTGNERIWMDALSKLKYIPTSILPEIINYNFQYANSLYSEAINLSIIIFHNNRPCALWPIIFIITKGEIVTVSHMHEIQSPIFIDGMSTRAVNRLALKCLCVLKKSIKSLDLSSLVTSDSFLGPQPGVSDWHRQCLNLGIIARVKYDLFLDLRLGIDGIRNKIRPTYRSLINSGSKKLDTHVLRHVDTGVWAEFRELHRKVSGRVTRTQSTWDLQLDAIRQKAAFFVYLRNDVGMMLGGALFYWTKDEALYAVAAYDRDHFDMPLGHLVQYTAIQEMLSLGVKWYKFGGRPFENDDPAPSDKELSISYFKEGFSSHLMPRFIFAHV
jgi:FemAB family protein